MTKRHRSLVVLAFFVLAGACLADAQVDPLIARATAYARAFFAGDDLQAYHDETMRDVMTPEAISNARTQLQATQGEFRSANEAWYEDTVQGFRRYRVPLRFQNGALDLRVVFNTDNLVAGMFLVPNSPPPPPPVAPPVEEVEIQVGDPKTGLPGTLSLPAGEGPFPAVVLVHGSGSMDRDETVGINKPFRDLAWGLAQQGVVVLRYDKRGFVRLKDLVDKGFGLTVEHEVIDDAVLALELLRGRPEVDANRVYLLGHSQGGTVAPRIAKRDGKVSGLVILAGATRPLPEKIAEQIRYLAGLDGQITDAETKSFAATDTVVAALRASLAGRGDDDGIYFGAPVGYWRDMEAHDPVAGVARLGTPALILQGGRDYQVTGDDYSLWREGLANTSGVCLRLYPTLDHLFRPGTGPSGPQDYERAEPVSPRVITDVATWILRGTCPTAN